MLLSFRARATLALFLSCATAAVSACGGSGSTDASGGGASPTSLAGAGGTTSGKGGAAGTAAGASGGSGQAGKSTGGSAGAGVSGSSGHAGSGAAGSSAGGSAGGAGSSGAAGKGAGGSGTGGSGGKAGASGAAGKSGAAGTGAGGSSTGGVGGSNQGQPVGLLITPGTISIDVKNGVSSPQQLTAKPVYQDGSVGTTVSTALWSILPADRAQVSSTGLVTATGKLGGAATVTAAWNGLSATADVTIKIYDTINPDGVPTGEQGPLDGATMPDTGQWIYPYDKTTFPRGLASPTLMWNGYTAGDEIKVSVVGAYVDVEAYFKPTGASVILPIDQWTHITESSGKGAPVSVKVSRLTGGTAKVLTQQTWTMASGNLRGTVYYWANSLGRVVRIKPGATAPDDFLAAAGVTDGCTTCHAVNANGSVLTIGGGTASGDSAASVFDLLGDQLVAKDRGRAWAMLALSPDGKYAALNNAPLPGGPGLSGGLYDVGSGAKLGGTGADGELFDMPAFAPDGSRLVYVDHNTHNLTSLAYAQGPGTPTLTGKMDLITASGDPTNNAIAFPSVSPDGKWAVYHHGNLDTRNGPGDLYLASTTQPGVEIPLDALNGTGYPFFEAGRDLHLNYEPTFMPVAAGGYFWVVFTSRRTYGNILQGPSNVTKQIWVAAIDLSPKAGTDPSHAAFWVSGQDLATLNMRAFWALDPCKDDGVGCAASSECCGGVCQSNNTCGEPPGQMCKPVGATCNTAADCCFADMGYMCINSHCTESKPLAPAGGARGCQTTCGALRHGLHFMTSYIRTS